MVLQNFTSVIVEDRFISCFKMFKSDEIYSKIVRFVFFKISILLQTHRYQTKNMVYVVI